MSRDSHIGTPLDDLYTSVSEAIMDSDALRSKGAPEADILASHSRVSLIEEEIASRLSPSDPEGAIARTGAVDAALASKQPGRAIALAIGYLAEDNLSSSSRRRLEYLLRQARDANRHSV